ncbi:flagellar hook assembly protein FlgD [Pseudomonas schmalbachii]|uniref:Basal-body rod modification protein FlgD n=1 Tax=Pseudomonas schmalbachii TaxID=2816993 RepID=A0ABS3TQ58_9PSED|nr:flagellar hook assembly protein FlgD [Pseudomonas schmalbachii]MBO3275799.1 flagellar hook assembly protein FlgD [Pseudomonas schmalbachii]
MNVDNSSASSAILSSLNGSRSAGSNADTGTNSLGKDSFLQLLVTQMNNQNPLEPQDNTAFVSQLAQFSSLESMQNLDGTLGSFYSSFQSSQALQASSLVGRSVIVASDKAQLESGATLDGSLAMPMSGDGVQVKIYDDSGELVRTIDLGTQKGGNVDFKWDGKDEDGNFVASGTYKFKASGSFGGTNIDLATYLPATVNSVTLGQNGEGMTLNLAGIGSVRASSVQTIGK